MRIYERNRLCTCKNCGQQFEAIRYNAETCSPKCRKAWSRKRAEIRRFKEDIDARLDILFGYRNSDLAIEAQAVARHVAKRANNIVDYWE